MRDNSEVGERHSCDIPSLRGLSLLVVDDNEECRFVYLEIFQQLGAEVRAASTVAQALALYADRQPDLVLSDLYLAGETGFDLITQLRARGETIPAIAVTASLNDGDRAASLGFDLYVNKPVNWQSLVQLIVRSVALAAIVRDVDPH